MEFKEKLELLTKKVNVELDRYFEEKESTEKVIYQAIRYSIMAGGKRLRPVLALAVCDMLERESSEILPYACAIEMIHTYSLIHDDLPAMDNDDYRRGLLTSHKVYGEAIAILSGDALLNYSFEIMLLDMAKGDTSEENLVKKLNAMSIIANASGINGMIAGQVIDMQFEEKEITPETLEYMHRLKTGALINAAIMASATICDAESRIMMALQIFSEKIGLAFQIKDDILDVEGDIRKMGKKSGSDAEKRKSTFVTLYGLEKSKEMLESITNEAIESIDYLGAKALFLKELSLYLLSRNH